MRRHLFDRSRVSTDLRCARQRYLQYHLNGRGIVKTEINFPLRIGSIIHDVIEEMFQAGDWERLMQEHLDRFAVEMYDGGIDPHPPPRQVEGVGWLKTRDASYYAYAQNEQLALIEGMLRGFHRYRLPRILDEFPEVFGVEVETTVDLGDGIEFMVKPDLLLLSKDGRIHYREHKTTAWNKPEWVNSWWKAPQLHVYAAALKRAGIEIDSMVIEGIYKGFRNLRVKQPRQESPLIYGYRRKGIAPYYQDDWSYVYQRGYYKTPVWDRPEGVKGWIAGMPDSVLGEQFLATPPITPSEAIGETWLRQRKLREIDIRSTVEDVQRLAEPGDDINQMMDRCFPQNFDQCTPSFGSWCPYVDICHGASDLNPLAAGFQPRVPHHAPEVELLEEREE